MAPAGSDVERTPWLRRQAMVLGLMGGIWLLAFVLRLWLLDSQVFGDEAAHYHVSRTMGASPTNTVPDMPMEPFFWQRPLFSLLLMPGAALGFEAYRGLHAAYASLIPVLVLLVLRRHGVGVAVAAGAAVVISVHPMFVLWGLRVFPDSLMTVFFLAGLLAWQHQRWMLSAVAFLGAVWIKEVALVGLGALSVYALVRARIAGRFGVWPLRFDRRTTGLFYACLLAPLPLLYAVYVLGGRMPGWSVSGLHWSWFDGFFLTAWVLPVLGVGVGFPRARPFVALALLYPLFYLVYASFFDGGVEGWYAVLPAALSLLALAVTLDAVVRAVHVRDYNVPQATAPIVAALFVLLFTLVAVAPTGSAARDLATPATDHGESLFDLKARLDHEHTLDEALAAVPDDAWEDVFLVDVGWYHIAWPFAERAGALGRAHTEGTPWMPVWVEAIENASRVTVLLETPYPMNQAIREVYDPCTLLANDHYRVIDGPACAGRGNALRERFLALSATAPDDTS